MPEPPAGWRLLRLDELGTVERGRSRHRPRNDPSLYGGKYPFVQTGDIKAAGLRLYDYTQTYSEAGLAQSRLWHPGTLCITIAANICDTAILGIPACFPDSIVGFTPHAERADVLFVKYALDFAKQRFAGISRGATQDNLSLEKMLSQRLPIPPISLQRRIASVLGAYDELIEVNRRRIALLEEMARRLFGEWFVRFRFPGHEICEVIQSSRGLAPSGWRICKVRDLVERQRNGRVYRKADCQQLGTVIVVDQSSDEILGYHSNEADHKATSTDPIAIFGDHTCKMGLLVSPFSIGPNTVAFKAKGTVNIYYLFAVIRGLTRTREYKRHWNELTNNEVLLAPDELTGAYADSVTPLFQFQETLRRQNRNLCRQRDLLLPRLVSGKLPMSAAERKLETAA